MVASIGWLVLPCKSQIIGISIQSNLLVISAATKNQCRVCVSIYFILDFRFGKNSLCYIDALSHIILNC